MRFWRSFKVRPSLTLSQARPGPACSNQAAASLGHGHHSALDTQPRHKVRALAACFKRTRDPPASPARKYVGFLSACGPTESPAPPPPSYAHEWLACVSLPLLALSP